MIRPKNWNPKVILNTIGAIVLMKSQIQLGTIQKHCTVVNAHESNFMVPQYKKDLGAQILLTTELPEMQLNKYGKYNGALNGEPRIISCVTCP